MQTFISNSAQGYQTYSISPFGSPKNVLGTIQVLSHHFFLIFRPSPPLCHRCPQCNAKKSRQLSTSRNPFLIRLLFTFVQNEPELIKCAWGLDKYSHIKTRTPMMYPIVKRIVLHLNSPGPYLKIKIWQSCFSFCFSFLT